MAGALDSGGAVVGVPAEGLRVAARSPEVRRRVHNGELCIASPYAPAMRFTAGNAMGRNKIVYGLADVTLVVCSDNGSGGTWEGPRKHSAGGFGPVAVWAGDGAGSGAESAGFAVLTSPRLCGKNQRPLADPWNGARYRHGTGEIESLHGRQCQDHHHRP